MVRGARELMVRSCVQLMGAYASICEEPPTRSDMRDAIGRYPQNVRKEAMKIFYQGS